MNGTRSLALACITRKITNASNSPCISAGVAA